MSRPDRFILPNGDEFLTTYTFTGIVPLVFLVIHLENFKFGDTQAIVVEG